MSDIKLFRVGEKGAEELPRRSVGLEKSLQTLIEKNLVSLLGVRFLASEYDTGRRHKGRIDTLGIDENNSPVIIEYKRADNQNVINQGLFYLDWLLDHQAEFVANVSDRLGVRVADEVDWSGPRLLCIAGDFTRYDEHAVMQIDRNIELIRYQKYGDDLLLLERVYATTTEPKRGKRKPGSTEYKTVTEALSDASKEVKDRYDTLKGIILDFGDDVDIKTLKFYFAFRRIKNFATVCITPEKGCIYIILKVDPKSITLEPGFTRDVTEIGHMGAGGLEVAINSDEDLNKAIPLIRKSYEVS